MPEVDFLKTAEVWDKDVSYEKVFDKIINFLEGKSIIKILAPGAGQGRFLLNILEVISNRVHNAQVSIVIVEPDKVAISKLRDEFKNNKFQNINFELREETLEEYLSKQNLKFDLIFCLLFFHYVSHCWISLLSELIKVLEKDGIFVFDEIIGSSEDCQLILNYIDCEFNELYSDKEPASYKTKELRDFFKQFYSSLLREESVLWARSVKGTNVVSIVNALKPLFRVNEEMCVFRDSILEIDILDAIKNKRHLPFWYGTTANTNFEKISNKVTRDYTETRLSYLQKCELRVGFRFYIFTNTKELSEEFLKDHWNIIKNKMILYSLNVINKVLPQVSESRTITYSSYDLYVNNLQMAAIHLLLTAGLLRWDSKINSIFVVHGKLTTSLHTPKLSKIVSLNRYSPQQVNRGVLSLAWLINYAIYAEVLKTSLSEKFIASGKIVEINIDDGIEELEINKQEDNRQSKIQIRIPAKTRIDIDYKENKLKMSDKQIVVNFSKLFSENVADKIKRFVWHDVIELDRKTEVPKDILEIANIIVENTAPITIREENIRLLENYFEGSKKIIEHIGVFLGNIGNIIFIPIPTIYSLDRNEYESLIGIGIAVQGKLESKDYEECENIKDILNLFFRPFQEAYLGLHWVETSRRHAMHSAVAAIMGRNMSHTIGSHVVAKLVENSKNEDFAFNKKRITKLLSYLQQKMDFIAQISTSIPTWVVEKDFKTIIDEFNEQEYLLDNIASFKGLRYKSSTSKNIRINSLKSYIVSIPTGNVGIHAFYSILENILRNSARHGYNPNIHGDLILTISISEWNDDFYEVNIIDNLGNANEELIRELNQKMSSSIIDDEGKVQSENWGMKEKKISSSYLRLIPQEDIDEKFKYYEETQSEQPPIIKAFPVGNNIVYKLYFIKPKKAIIFSPTIKEQLSDKDPNNFAKYGIEFIEKFEEIKNNLGKFRHKFLVIEITTDNEQNWLKENWRKLPFRTLVIGDFKFEGYGFIENILPRSITHNFTDADSLYSWLWKSWVQKKEYFNKYNISVRMDTLSEQLKSSWEKIGINIIDDETDDKDIELINKKLILIDHMSSSDTTKLYDKVFCHLPFSKSSTGGSLWSLITDDNELTLYEFIETSCIRIDIVDSRIWDAKANKLPVHAYTGNDNTKSLIKVWEKRGVKIHDISKIINNFEEFVNNIGNIDLLIFHQGEIDEIINRMGKMGKTEDDFDEIWKKLLGKVKDIVIDTGRGIPKQAKKDKLRWIQYSLIQEWLITNGEDMLAKYNLLKLLFSLRAET